LFAGEKQQTTAAPQPVSQSPPPPSDTPWLVKIKQVIIDKYGIFLEDRKPATSVRIAVNPLTIKLENVSSKLQNAIKLDLSAKVNETGTIGAKGDVIAAPLPLNLDLDVDKIAFVPFQPYLDEIAQLNLKGGSASIKGHYSLRPKDGAAPRMRF